MTNKRWAMQAAALCAVALAGMGIGYAEGQRVADSPGGQVHISVTYDESGEIATVDLTDAEGNDVPVGSVAESWTDDNADSQEG